MVDWITTAEASKVSGYHLNHVRRLLRAGEVIGRKWGAAWMVSRESLLKYMKSIEAKGDRRGPKPQKISPLKN